MGLALVACLFRASHRRQGVRLPLASPKSEPEKSNRESDDMAEGEDQNVPLEALTPDEVDNNPDVGRFPMIGVLQVGDEVKQAVTDYNYLRGNLTGSDGIGAANRAFDIFKVVYETKRG